jgi:DNA-binding MarR family transcriptional regulator
MAELDEHAKTLSEILLNDLIKINLSDSSVKFFTHDLTTMIIWLYIMNSYANKKKINIEDIAREISTAARISKPSLRLILENAKEKGFIKFTHNTVDSRSWIVEPETLAIEEFNTWAKRIGSLIIT